MTNTFKNMNAQEIVENIWDTMAEDVAQVDAAFEALKSLDAGVRKDVVDALEKLVIDDTRKMVSKVKTFGPMSSMEAILSQFGEAPKDLAAAQSSCQLLLHVSQIKGDEAQPATKAIVKEISTLPDEGYNSYSKLIVAVVKAVD